MRLKLSVFSILVIIFSIFALAACGGSSTPTPEVSQTVETSTPTPSPTQTPEPTPTPTPTPTQTPEPTPTPTPEPTAVPTEEPATPVPAEEPSDGPFLVEPAEYWRGNVNSNKIALTFDAGAARGSADMVLDTLAARGIKVTFFLTGKWSEENPDLVARMAAEGHELANHTYNHPDLRTISDAEITEQLQSTERIVSNISGISTKPWFRPPFGARNQHVLEVAARNGYQSIFWTVDSLDSVGEPKTVDFIIERVTNPTDGDGNPIPLNGAIILQHVGSDVSAQALPAILDRLAAQGLQVVTVSEVLR